MISNKKGECIMKGCNEDRFEDKFFCEDHWKNRRKNYKYKDRWEND